MPPKSRFDWELARHLWAHGKTAKEVAAVIGCSVFMIYRKRCDDGDWPAHQNRGNTRVAVFSSRRSLSGKGLPTRVCTNCGVSIAVDRVCVMCGNPPPGHVPPLIRQDTDEQQLQFPSIGRRGGRKRWWEP